MTTRLKELQERFDPYYEAPEMKRLKEVESKLVEQGQDVRELKQGLAEQGKQFQQFQQELAKQRKQFEEELGKQRKQSQQFEEELGKQRKQFEEELSEMKQAMNLMREVIEKQAAMLADHMQQQASAVKSLELRFLAKPPLCPKGPNPSSSTSRSRRASALPTVPTIHENEVQELADDSSTLDCQDDCVASKEAPSKRQRRSQRLSMLPTPTAPKTLSSTPSKTKAQSKRRATMGGAAEPNAVNNLQIRKCPPHVKDQFVKVLDDLKKGEAEELAKQILQLSETAAKPYRSIVPAVIQYATQLEITPGKGSSYRMSSQAADVAKSFGDPEVVELVAAILRAVSDLNGCKHNSRLHASNVMGGISTCADLLSF